MAYTALQTTRSDPAALRAVDERAMARVEASLLRVHPPVAEGDHLGTGHG